MSLYLVDAGGSKTHAVICDEQGNILGKGASGNGNHQIHREHAARNIEEACNAALQEAGAPKKISVMLISAWPEQIGKPIMRSCVR